MKCNCEYYKAEITRLRRRIGVLEKQASSDSWADEYNRNIAERLSEMERDQSGESMGR